MRSNIETILLTLIFLIIFTSCNNTAKEREQLLLTIPHDIRVSDMVFSIGGNKDNFDTQVISYEITLKNTDVVKKHIKWVEPELSQEFKSRILSKDLKIQVEKEVEPNAFLTIEFEIEFDSKGMSKEDIIKLQPYVTELKVITESEIII